MARKPFNPNLVQPPQREAKTTPTTPVTVSQVTAMVQAAIETALPPTVHVVGEVSNFKRHSSGHLYLTLKDRYSELACVMWRSAAVKLKFTPTDGLEVIATGNIEVFERAGRYQLYIRKLEPRGAGALDLAFRQLREKLDKEGLFDKRHKRPLPCFPQRLVIVTSPTGAAIADILRTIERRFPCIRVFVWPVRVQGAGAAEEIARAIGRANAEADQLGGVDLMIVGRGGGSLEDLWAFNEEVVARAIYASAIPIISAVGHEVDVTIADLVADVRAPTPTAAAEIAVPVLDDLLQDLAGWSTRLTRSAHGRLTLCVAHLAATSQRSALRQPQFLVQRREQIIDEISSGLQHRVSLRVGAVRKTLDKFEPIVRKIAPHAFLLRTTVRLGNLQHRLRWAVWHGHSRCHRLADTASRRLERASPANALARLAQRLDRVGRTLPRAVGHQLALLREDLRRKDDLLAALSYRSVLSRGFSITRSKRGRKVLRSPRQVKDGDRIISELAEGKVESTVHDPSQMELFE